MSDYISGILYSTDNQANETDGLENKSSWNPRVTFKRLAVRRKKVQAPIKSKRRQTIGDVWKNSASNIGGLHDIGKLLMKRSKLQGE